MAAAAEASSSRAGIAMVEVLVSRHEVVITMLWVKEGRSSGGEGCRFYRSVGGPCGHLTTGSTAVAYLRNGLLAILPRELPAVVAVRLCSRN